MSHKAPQWEDASAAVNRADTILITTHIRPDGDAIGSALGLANALSQIGKKVTVAIDDPVPYFLAWLPNADSIVDTLENGTWDLMISTDASDAGRSGHVGAYGQANSKILINLDHHETNTYFGDIFLVVPTASSAAEVVYNWWQYMDIELNRDIAQALLTGLVTDTLGFRTASTTSQTLAVAQGLIEAGASLVETTQRTLEIMTANELKVWKRIMPSIEIHGEVVEAVVRREDIEAVGMISMSTGPIVGFLRKVDIARVAVVFMEEGERDVKISMRSKPGYDVAQVAFELGGGGHKQAAGAELAMTIEEAREKVLPMLQKVTANGILEIG
jgi:phosphoesterase RecJ-like protein